MKIWHFPFSFAFQSHTQQDSVPPFHMTTKCNQQNHKPGHASSTCILYMHTSGPAPTCMHVEDNPSRPMKGNIPLTHMIWVRKAADSVLSWPSCIPHTHTHFFTFVQSTGSTWCFTRHLEIMRYRALGRSSALSVCLVAVSWAAYLPSQTTLAAAASPQIAASAWAGKELLTLTHR